MFLWDGYGSDIYPISVSFAGSSAGSAIFRIGDGEADSLVSIGIGITPSYSISCLADIKGTVKVADGNIKGIRC